MCCAPGWRVARRNGGVWPIRRAGRRNGSAPSFRNRNNRRHDPDPDAGECPCRSAGRVAARARGSCDPALGRPHPAPATGYRVPLSGSTIIHGARRRTDLLIVLLSFRPAPAPAAGAAPCRPRGSVRPVFVPRLRPTDGCPLRLRTGSGRRGCWARRDVAAALSAAPRGLFPACRHRAAPGQGDRRSGV